MNAPDSNNGPVELPPESSELPIGLPIEPGVLPPADLSEIPLAVILEDYRLLKHEVVGAYLALHKVIIDLDARVQTELAKPNPNHEFITLLQNAVIPRLQRALKEINPPREAAADKKMGTRERNEWAKLVMALSRLAKIKLDQPYAAARDIQESSAKYGVTWPTDVKAMAEKLEKARDYEE